MNQIDPWQRRGENPKPAHLSPSPSLAKWGDGADGGVQGGSPNPISESGALSEPTLHLFPTLGMTYEDAKRLEPEHAAHFLWAFCCMTKNGCGIVDDWYERMENRGKNDGR